MKKLFIAIILFSIALFGKGQTIYSRNVIKSWFQTGDLPTQSQYWHLFDSYWHKQDTIPFTSISGFVAGTDSVYQRGDTVYGRKNDSEYIAAIINPQGLQKVWGVNGIHNINDSTIEVDSNWIEGLDYFQQFFQNGTDSLYANYDADSIVTKVPRTVNDGDIVLIINPVNGSQFANFPNYLAQNLDGDTTTWNYIPPANGLTVDVAHDGKYKYINTEWVFQNVPLYQNGNKNGLNVYVGTNDAYYLNLRTNGKNRMKFDKNGVWTWVKYINLDSNKTYVLGLKKGVIDTLPSQNLVGIIVNGDTTFFDVNGFANLGTIAGGGGASALSGLSDVNITSIADGQLLKYDNASSKWKNFTPSYATLTGTETLTNKTFTSPLINLGSDATGDMYYRNGSGLFTRLPIGSVGSVLTPVSGIPAWSTIGVTDTLPHTIYANTGQAVTTKLYLSDTTAATATRFGYAPAIEFDGTAYSGNSYVNKMRLSYTTLANCCSVTSGTFNLDANATASGGTPTGWYNVLNVTTAQGNSYLNMNGNISVSASLFGNGFSFVGTTPTIFNLYGSTNSLILQRGSGSFSSTSGTYDYFTVRNKINVGNAGSGVINDFVIDRDETTNFSTGAQNLLMLRRAGTPVFSISTFGVVNLQRPIATSGSTPSYTLGTGAGTSPTASITGNDIAGYITVNTGTSPTAGGDIITITFATALTNTPKSITLTRANENATADVAKYYPDEASASTTSFKIKNVSSAALQASTTYIFYYNVTQ